MDVQAKGLVSHGWGGLKVDNLFTETFTCDGWRVSADRMAEDRCLNKLVN
jgi:hypothetical protein